MWRGARLAVVCAVLGWAPPAAAAGEEVEAPVTAVTVYGDRARVTRTATVTLQGRRTVVFPVLGGSVDPGTLRLESPDAQVETFEIGRVSDDELPVDEARQLLDALEKLDERIAQAQREIEVWREFDLGPRLRPVTPALDGPRAPPRVDGRGLAPVLGFARSFSDRVAGKVRELGDELRELGEERQRLAIRAHRLGAGGRKGGYRVRARVEGHGRARLHLSAMSRRARWQPAYDIRFDPRDQKVSVYFGALVAQETGEDWVEARLTVSTAAPGSATTWPRLPVWKIGEQERFVPTPYAAPRPQPPAPPAVPPREGVETPAMVRERLRGELLAKAGTAPGFRRAQMETESDKGERESTAGPEINVYAEAPKVEAARPPPPPPAPAMAPAPRRASAMADVAVANVEVLSASKSSDSSRRSVSVPVESFGLRPPGVRGEAPPPAAFAGGYDLVYQAAAPETVRSAKGTRRVALFVRSFPVAVERRIFAGVSDDTFLVGLMRNPLGHPLPEGDARLFVGADPAGTAHLGLVGAGQTAVLPLGVDAAIKPIRHVDVETKETGLISKDEVSTYRVTVELANPYGVPLSVRIVEQLPIAQDDHVKVKRLSAEPRTFEAQDADGRELARKGGVEWRLVVPARARQVVRLVYALERPKGYRLHQ